MPGLNGPARTPNGSTPMTTAHTQQATSSDSNTDPLALIVPSGYLVRTGAFGVEELYVVDLTGPQPLLLRMGETPGDTLILTQGSETLRLAGSGDLYTLDPEVQDSLVNLTQTEGVTEYWVQ